MPRCPLRQGGAERDTSMEIFKRKTQYIVLTIVSITPYVVFRKPWSVSQKHHRARGVWINKVINKKTLCCLMVEVV